MSFLNELKRRNVVRASVAYAVAAWLVLQVADVILPNLGAPDWAFKAILMLLIAGFPLALIIAWVFELTPEGLQRESDIEQQTGNVRFSGRRLDFAIIGLLAIAVGYFAYDKFLASPGSAGQSVAVLPFVNNSTDVQQEYFADGLSEELLNLLARIPGLRVIARTSSFAYKGKDVKISDIANDLNVDHVLEGSVRKYQGEKVRITAQLVRADNESNLWGQAYDVTLDDVFAVQDRIAAAVVDQLKIRLLEDAPKAQKTNAEAYALYLQGRELSRQATAEGHTQAVRLYWQALDIEPGYANAWAGIAENFIFLAERALNEPIAELVSERRCTDAEAAATTASQSFIQQAFAEARCAANTAVQLDAENAPAHASLSRILMVNEGDLAASAAYMQTALQLEPTNSRIVRQAAVLAANVHHLDDALALMDYAAKRDPVSSAVHANLALIYYYVGRYDDAIAAYRTALNLAPNAVGIHSWLGVTHVLNGDPERGLEVIEKEPDRPWQLVGATIANHALERAAEADKNLSLLIEEYGHEWAFNIAYVMAYRGDTQSAFEWLERARVQNDAGLSEIVAEPTLEQLRSQPGWLPFLRSIGKAPEQLEKIQFEVALPSG